MCPKSTRRIKGLPALTAGLAAPKVREIEPVQPRMVEGLGQAPFCELMGTPEKNQCVNSVCFGV